ncbi:restriction endonuclease subunit S [uncultured Flavobacterium sp.]|uniref:restriction endonuclease subunit S n=1 Tax=uncultured Flavobacterium sp. TaxID=165435 RepID=UPI0025EEBBA2|nr:restriction endonuclease subunit S [uncultured Flavobacterium sp.]
MENSRRISMVRGNNARKLDIFNEGEKDYTFLPERLKFTSISLQDVLNNKTRFEASAFNIDAKTAVNKVKESKYGYVNLWSKDGLVEHAYYPGRFKRIYVPKGEGKAFFLPSQLTEINPKPTKYISPKTYKTLKGIEIEPNNLLLTRSGTIGKCSISSKSNVGQLYSDDVIRVAFRSVFDVGYTYAFLNTKEGQQILQTNNYGAVVKHIEPEHLESVIIPNAPDAIKREIHQLITESFELRDKSNELINRAESILYNELQLPEIQDLKPEYLTKSSGIRNFKTNLRNLRFRLDCSYHLPIVKMVEDAISLHAKEITTIEDVSQRVILAGVFKRTYVDSDNGVAFLGGRDITQLNPKVEKFLSRAVHHERIKKELEVFENYVLISDRGTIGKVQIVPQHWSGWTVSQNVIKIVPLTDDIAGYLYCFLSSDYGQVLIKRETYGSVVDMIDNKNVNGIHIPLLKNEKKQKEINDLVLKANKIRYQAFLKEEKATGKMQAILNND